MHVFCVRNWVSRCVLAQSEGSSLSGDSSREVEDEMELADDEQDEQDEGSHDEQDEGSDEEDEGSDDEQDEIGDDEQDEGSDGEQDEHSDNEKDDDNADVNLSEEDHATTDHEGGR